MKKLKDNWYMIGFVFKFAPAMFILKILTMFTSLAVHIGFNIFFFKKVVDSMQYGGDFRDVLCYICAIGALIVLDGILSSIFAEKINPVGTLKIHKGMQRLIMEKIKTVDLEKYDDPDFYNSYILAVSEADNCSIRSFNILTSFISNIIAMLSFSGIAIFMTRCLSYLQ